MDIWSNEHSHKIPPILRATLILVKLLVFYIQQSTV